MPSMPGPERALAPCSATPGRKQATAGPLNPPSTRLNQHTRQRTTLRVRPRRTLLARHIWPTLRDTRIGGLNTAALQLSVTGGAGANWIIAATVLLDAWLYALVTVQNTSPASRARVHAERKCVCAMHRMCGGGGKLRAAASHARCSASGAAAADQAASPSLGDGR